MEKPITLHRRIFYNVHIVKEANYLLKISYKSRQSDQLAGELLLLSPEKAS